MYETNEAWEGLPCRDQGVQVALNGELWKTLLHFFTPVDFDECEVGAPDSPFEVVWADRCNPVSWARKQIPFKWGINQFGDLERAMLRNGNVHSADDWRMLLEPIVDRYCGQGMRRLFRADAAFANPDVHSYLEEEGFLYAIRLPANQAQHRVILRYPLQDSNLRPLAPEASALFAELRGQMLRWVVFYQERAQNQGRCRVPLGS